MQAPSPPAPAQPAPAPNPIKRANSNRVSKRSSVFTIAAARIIQQNPAIFDEAIPEAAAEEQEGAASVVDNELDWSPGSEFSKFANIVTVPSLLIPETPAITEEYMTTLKLY